MLVAASSSACVLDYEVGNNLQSSATGDDPEGTSTEPDTASCGDGVVDEGEACDDGNDDPVDGCDLECNQGPVLEWTRTDGGEAGGGLVPNSIALDPTGRIVVVGSDLDPESFDETVVIVFEADGSVAWRRSLPAAGQAWSTFTDVLVDGQGRIFAAGHEHNEDGDFATILRSFGPDGEDLWAVHEPQPLLRTELRGLAFGPGGLYSVGGERPLGAAMELVVRRHDLATGATTWKVNHKGEVDMIAADLAVSDSRLVAVGHTMQADGATPHPLVVVVDIDGTIVSSAAEDERVGEWFSAAPIGANGDLVLAGYLRPTSEDPLWDARLRRVDAAGTELWSFVDDANSWFQGVAVRPDETIVAIGSGRMGAGHQPHTYMRRLTGDGTTVWASRLLDLPGAEREGGHAIAFGPTSLIAAGNWWEDHEPEDRVNMWVRRFADE